MKIYLLPLILFFLSFELYAQQKNIKKATVLTKAEAEELEELAGDQKNDFKYIIKYVVDVKLKELEKSIPKIEKSIIFYKKKLALARKKSTKAKYQKLLLEEETKLAITKLWKAYKKYYIQYKINYGKNYKLYQEGLSAVNKINVRYKQLTSKDFPDPEVTFRKSPKGRLLQQKRDQTKKGKRSKKK
jgi:hypothetical protein